MRRSGWKEAAIAVLFVALNTAVVIYGVGMENEVFSWKAFAQTYAPPGTDPGTVTSDPSGCFYDPATGQMIPGATISVSGAGTVTDDGFTDGCYDVALDGTAMMAGAQLSGPPSPLVLSIQAATLPIGCSVDPCWLPTAVMVPQGSVMQAGNLPDPGNPGYLTAPGCTTFYSPITFEGGGLGSAVTANNIPLLCVTPPAQAPILSTAGWLVLGLLLFGLGWIGLRQRGDEAA
jgi:hypothetical protein